MRFPSPTTAVLSALTIAAVGLGLTLNEAGERPERNPMQEPFPGAPLAPPTDPRGEGEGEEGEDRAERARWIEQLHLAAPGVDWRAIERANQAAELERRNEAAVTDGGGPVPWVWDEVGSKNQAGHTRCAALGTTRAGERHLYVGSAGGGLWRGREDGSEWTPLSDAVYGGVDDVVALEPANLADDDVLLMRQGNSVLRSADAGLTWQAASGLTGVTGARRMVRAADALQTVYLFGTANVPGIGEKSALFASVDRGQTFDLRYSFGARWSGDIWVPRTSALGGSAVYILQRGRIFVSQDDGFSFAPGLDVDTAATAGDIVGSEAGGPTLYVALRQSSGDWNLHRSDDAGQSSVFVRTLNSFWGSTQSMAAFAHDASRLVYGGVEAWVSTDGGASSSRINTWGSYYGDPANRLHADIRGMSPLVDLDAPGEPDLLFINTDGGTYLTSDGGASVQNLCLEGLGVGQFYSTHTSTLDPRRISGGTQDQGYQVGLLDISATGPGPTTDFEQIISGDYGHLVSGDGTHDLVYSTYPGFILVQDGEVNPTLRFLDFPTGSSQLWLPPVVADPNNPNEFFFLAERLYHYDRPNAVWSPSVWSTEDFATGNSDYLAALAFAPSDPTRAYSVTNNGRLYHSSDGGVSWTLGSTTGPGSHYFSGSALLVDPQDPDHAFVAGSGYSNPAVRETTDGGVTWQARSAGLPNTLVHDIAWSPDGSGDLFAAAEAGAFHFDAASASWSNAMGTEAPATNYWSVETVPASPSVRFGTYGRGIWDLTLVNGGDVGVKVCAPAVPNVTGAPGVIRAMGSPFVADNDLLLVAESLPSNTLGFFLASPTPGSIPNPGGSIGILCLGGPFGRYQSLAQSSGLLGSIVIPLDLTAIAQPTGPAAGQPGQTWFFQAWYRDSVLSLPTSNFTDAIAVRLR
ncbi:MAG: hypothetical protein P8M11_10740 [Planctomycetota bacterium]|nr:hypothetical protein [Planctomycetota bacterium]